jgi:thioredoxin 2
VAFSAITACPSCGAKNRIPAAHLADTGRCGVCKQSLEPVHEPLEVDSRAFREIISTAKVPVLVDFWAPWCGPCRMAAPEIHKLAQEMGGRALVLKVNADDNPALAQEFQIMTIPHFLVFRDGRAVSERTGVAPKAEMRRWLEAA